MMHKKKRTWLILKRQNARAKKRIAQHAHPANFAIRDSAKWKLAWINSTLRLKSTEDPAEWRESSAISVICRTRLAHESVCGTNSLPLSLSRMPSVKYAEETASKTSVILKENTPAGRDLGPGQEHKSNPDSATTMPWHAISFHAINIQFQSFPSALYIATDKILSAC